MNHGSIVFCLIYPPSSLADFHINDEKSFSQTELDFLKKNLLLNFLDTLTSIENKDKIQIKIFFEGSDEEKYFEDLPQQFSDILNIHLCSNSEKIIEEIKIFSKFFFVISDVMGISAKDIITTDKLISADDNTLVISKSENEDVCFIAFNTFDEDLVNKMLTPNFNYENFLSGIAPDKFFIHIINGHFRVNNFSNFKLLYKKLSTKESLEYCNQKMHENFTNLFIEYRDYIK